MEKFSLDKVELSGAIELLSKKLAVWYEAIIKSIPNIIVAVIVFILFLILAQIIKKISAKLVPRITKSRSVSELLQSITKFLVIILGLFVSLEILNLEKTVTSLLAGAGVLGLALGFAFQEIASNFVSGIFIAFKEPYKVGDIVEVEDNLGEVQRITLRTTSIITFQGLEVLIPNKDMFTKVFTNYTTTPKRRLDIPVGVSYGDDLEKVEQITIKALESLEERIENHDVEVFYEEFGSSSINLTARVWIKYPGKAAYFTARHQAIKNIKAAYDENNITIPFPIRTLDFGIKGGKDLSEMNISSGAE